MTAKTIADRLKELVPERQKSEMARKCGIPAKSFSSYIDGVEPSASRLVELARGLEVNLLWLATGEGPKRHEGQITATALPSVSTAIDELEISARLQRIEADFYNAGPMPFTGPVAERRAELLEIAMNSAMPEKARMWADRLLSAGFEDKEAARRMDERWERHVVRQRLMRSKIEAIGAEFKGTVSPNFIGDLTMLAMSHPLSETDIQMILAGAHLLTYEALGKLDLGWKPDIK